MATSAFVRQETVGLATLVDHEFGTPFGRYVLLDRIASGGMGEIFLARQASGGGFARLVAVKRILQHYTSDDKHVSMFYDEARLQSLLSDRHIVQIYDMGECDEHHFIAMEFVHGVSMRRLVQRATERGLRLHAAHVCDLAVQMCRGLSYAHNVADGSGRPLHIVHRDINPQNVLVSYDGEVKLIDFGIAKSEMSAIKTETGTLKGKLTYMSPEQARGEKLDRRSDLFSVGICVYEMLAGQNPFERGNVILSLQAIEADPVAPITTVRDDVAGFDPVLQRLLAKDRDARFHDGTEAVQLLVDAYAKGGFGEAPMPLGDFMQALFADEIKAQRQRLEKLGVSLAVRQRPAIADAALAHAFALDVEVSDPSRRLPRAPASEISGPVLPPATLVPDPITEPTSSGPHPAALEVPPTKSGSALAAGLVFGVLVGGAALVALAVLPSPDPEVTLHPLPRDERADVDAGATGTRVAVNGEASGATTTGDGAGAADGERGAATTPGEQQTSTTTGHGPLSEEAPRADGAHAEQVRAEKERADRAEKERADKERADKERADKERADKERADRERADKERADRERARKKAEKEPPPPAPAPDPATTTTAPPPAPTGPRAKIAVRASAGYVWSGGGLGGSSGTTTVEASGRKLTVKAEDGSGLKVTLTTKATDGGAEVAIESAPFAIVRVDNIGKGKTPLTVKLDDGRPTEIFLKSPQGGELTLSIKASAPR